MNGKRQGRGLILRNYFVTLGMGLAAPAVVTPAVILVIKAERIGPWWIPILFAYIILFYVFESFLINRKHMRIMQLQLGPELFYEQYPSELKKALRRARKTPHPEKERILGMYRERMDCTEADTRHEKRFRIGAILYFVAAAIVFGLSAYCLYGLFRGEQNGAKMDLARILRLVSVGMMLIVAITELRRSGRFILQGITAIVLFLDLWANLANALMMPKTHSFAPAIEALILFLIFCVAAIGLSLVAKLLRSELPSRREHQEFNLALYELGVIDEKEIAYRFEQ